MLASSTLIGTAADARHHPRHHSSRSSSSGSEYYTAHSGNRVHRPVRASRAPSGASARCRDGSWSFSESRRGTCSHHGGVATWL
uniref:DUF3761 domain-containing protein n=1 Tax=Sphingomonas bacterium TaxID=1895847 RepID=UPI003412A53B